MAEVKCIPAPKWVKKKSFSEEDFAAICKALGHPARVRLLKILIAKGACISGDLADEFSLAQSTVSEHLRILKDAALVQGTIDGPKRCYCVKPETIEYLKGLVASL